MAAVWKGSQHGGSALLMMLAIADFSDDKGVAFPSVNTLAEKTRMKPRNANYLLSELAVSGELVIKIGAGRHGTNLYRIALERLQGVQGVAGVHSGAGVQPSAGLHSSARGGAPHCTPPLHPSAPKPSLNHQEPSLLSAEPSAARLPVCPHRKLIALFVEKVPELPKPKPELWSGKNANAMQARWKWVLTATRENGERYAATEAEAFSWFGRFFERVQASDFLTGRDDAWTGCSLGWLMKAENFAKVVSGNYVNRSPA